MGFVLFLAAWEGSIAAGWMPRYIVAPPSSIYDATLTLFQEGEFGSALMLTLGLVAISMAVAISIGVPVGYFLYRWSNYGTAFEPWLGALFASPLPLAYPIFLVLFGRSYVTIVVMALTYATIPIIINTREGLLSVRPVLLNVGHSFNVPQRTIFWKILVPAALPTIFSGIRLGLIYGLLAVVAIEFLTDLGGLGRLISDLNFRFKVPETFAGITFVVFISATFFIGSKKVEQWLQYR